MYSGILAKQLAKQRIVGSDPRGLTPAERADYVRKNVLAAIKELTEALDEVGWKWWATSEHFNPREFAEEIADVQLFLDNLILLLLDQPDGSVVDTDQLEEYMRGIVEGKIQQCIDRHQAGYDGFVK